MKYRDKEKIILQVTFMILFLEIAMNYSVLVEVRQAPEITSFHKLITKTKKLTTKTKTLRLATNVETLFLADRPLIA